MTIHVNAFMDAVVAAEAAKLLSLMLRMLKSVSVVSVEPEQTKTTTQLLVPHFGADKKVVACSDGRLPNQIS